MVETFDLSWLDYGEELNSTENHTHGNSTDWNTEEGSHVKLQVHHILIVFLYTLIIVLGVPGNAIVIWITGFKMKRSVNSIWFLNLACADLLCCLTLPFMMYTIIHDHHWPFGLHMCKAVSGFILINMFCSIFLLGVISLDRLILVAKPVWCQNHRNARRASVTCILVWILALLLSLPLFIHRREFKDIFSDKIICEPGFSYFGQNVQAIELGMRIYQFLVGFLFPFGSITVCHFLIFRRVSQNGRGFGNRTKKTVRVICAVIVTFFVCWLPYHIMSILIAVTPSNSPWHFHLLHIDLFAVTLAYFNSCLNPLLYVCMGQDFKERMRKSLKSVMENFMNDEMPSHAVATLTTKSSSISDRSTHI
ncbi:C5a anaphylatoxin chemotactic receptor 1-like [Erpetoichthys calabaricus]|uniref:C5a anaphylatoxin chemotactic receptor 1-like n=1 Tax=Erpetoichthys calabaricus TaxID=27687 RepID=UPI002234DCAF|nr:C5a anaphylatoxin chemotactic receptor 1-like [Erpetoichthys calabaricus]